MQNIKLIDLVNRQINDRNEQQRIVSLVAGVILGTNSRMPAEKVEDISAHYRAMHRIAANTVISKVNESILLDIPYVQHLAESIYFSRYQYAFSCGIDQILNPVNILSDEDKELLIKHNQVVTVIFTNLYNEIYA